ncbi:MAG: quaternary ammonium compound efflux SMR transporter SugE [Candidatus Babeliales bacterium]|nr:quaternary ammonium compound efflux SMR transporter SugE [Candidatus Babeliales bacterium]
MVWIYLLIAGIFEVIWALGLKYCQNFTQIIPSVITLGATFASFWFLSLALKTIPMGTAYAIWTGIGTIGTVICGIVLFNEPINLPRILSFILIIAGIIGLKFFDHV